MAYCKQHRYHPAGEGISLFNAIPRQTSGTYDEENAAHGGEAGHDELAESLIVLLQNSLPISSTLLREGLLALWATRD
jgi:hypothetical protein